MPRPRQRITTAELRRLYEDGNARLTNAILAYLALVMHTAPHPDDLAGLREEAHEALDALLDLAGAGPPGRVAVKALDGIDDSRAAGSC